MKSLSLVLIGAALAATPAMAAAQSQPQQQPQALAGSTNNMNEVVCERQTVVGSRLAHTKVCLTRSQWEDARRQDRALTDKVQQQRGFIGEASGTPCIAGRTTQC